MLLPDKVLEAPTGFASFCDPAVVPETPRVHAVQGKPGPGRTVRSKTSPTHKEEGMSLRGVAIVGTMLEPTPTRLVET